MRSEPGARAGNGTIPLSVPQIHVNEWRYVKECLDTSWVSSAGPFVDRFEAMVAAYVGTKCAVATVNGTAALHVALIVAGVQSGDEVLVSTLSFIAPANAIRYIGAWPVFIDADPACWQMDPGKAVDFLEKECRWRNGSLENKITGRRVRAVLPVHILGHPCDMDPIIEAARKYDLAVVEDATESLGAQYKGRKVGRLGDISCLSFNGNKIITTGGGGMILTANQEWSAQARYLTTQAKDDPVEYIHKNIGFNYRLTNIQAALGCAQMEKLEEHLLTKLRIAARYRAGLAGIRGITGVTEAPWARSTFWLYTILVDRAAFGMCRRELMKRFESSGIETRPLWQPLHESPAYDGCQAYHCEAAGPIQERSLSLPSSVGLGDTDQDRVIEVLKTAGRIQSGQVPL